MRLPLLRNSWRIGIISLAGTHTAVACLQQSMNSDGLNYLTLGAAYWRGDWNLAINGIWSPLYGVVVGGVLELFRPPIAWVFPAVQIVNLAIFVVSLVCFERLWGELHVAYEDRTDPERPLTLSPRLWWSIGYALFLWAGLNLIEMWAVTPDMMVAATVYLSASYMVRIARGGSSLRTYLALGATLGIGYLAKAPMFPLGIVALVLVALRHRNPVQALRPTSVAVAAFLLVAGPFLVVLSVQEGHPTFSEVSRFTYLKHVNRIPYPHWTEGSVDGVGVANHPPRQVHSDPDLFVFEGPIGGSYPASFNPDYWTEGLRPRITAFDQINALANNLAFFFDLFLGVQGAFLGVFALAAVVSLASGRPRLRDGDWELVAWSLACFGMYSVVFVTGRYVGPFVVILWGGLISYWRFGSPPVPRVLSTAAGTLLVALTLTDVVALNLEGFSGLVGLRPPVEEVGGQFTDGPSAPPHIVAAAVRELGIEPGTDVAYIGYSFTASWAYLAEVRIVAEIWPEEAPSFWRADAAEQEEVLLRFREAGAKYLIAQATGGGAAGPGWLPIGGTGYLMRALD